MWPRLSTGVRQCFCYILWPEQITRPAQIQSKGYKVHLWVDGAVKPSTERLCKQGRDAFVAI